ncbi:MAG: hypothetical protein JZU60_03170 [Ilumatobacteraceae bacterium]|nr:hypothetical protein [Ilumatobacteraceae bacterium]
MADEESDGRRWIGAGAAEFLASTTSKMLSGSSVMALILSIFEFSVAMVPMNAPKCLFAESVSFVVRRCACQLLLGACQLTFGMFTFTFYELETSSRRLIRFDLG